jgi:DNA-binding NarL/FixJ family response regulator
LVIFPQYQPDWLLLDLMLPDGDGIKVLEHVRKIEAPVKVCILTGCGDQNRLDAVKQLGPDGFITKPVDFAVLMELLEPGDGNGQTHG